jgi:formylglycine-generating enzyme required for sulfatase activity
MKFKTYLVLVLAFCCLTATTAEVEAKAKRKKKSKVRSRSRSAASVTMGTPTSLRMAVRDLMKTFGRRYPKGASYLERLAVIEKQMGANGPAIPPEFAALQREALGTNPLLGPDLLVVKRKGHNGMVSNWLGNCSLPRSGFDDEIAILKKGKLTTLYKPKGRVYVGDVDLHFGGKRMLFSSIGTNGRWQVFEIGIDGGGLRQVTKGAAPDVDNYDACYLPSGRIIYSSTACYHSVPCIGGSQPVANLYSMDADGGKVRRLCFDQDHDWYPSVMADGRVMYTRWEYTDVTHFYSRLLMTMNPDGTSQQALYGSNSYWPNSVFYARVIPGHSTKVAGIVSGHHGLKRMGELVIFDPAKGRVEADGVVQRIPGFGKIVKPIILDNLAGGSWPRFLHPYPLSEKYFLVAAQPRGAKRWGIYLADIFDNIVPICELPDAMLFEPVPITRRPTPPVIPSRVDLKRTDATVLLMDIYKGPGLKGVPRGKVKQLRVFAYHFAYNKSGGWNSVGMESGWDIKRILGTVPVETDGSVLFRIPANTPISVQPLDKDGRALQLMRSWFVGMPGEALSCIGCHEPASDAPPPGMTAAARRASPRNITPWLGPARPFAFATEVRPVLDKYCAGCHDGKPRPDGRKIPNFSKGDHSRYGRDVAYMSLHPYVRRPGPECDYHLLKPMEYHVSTSPLFQMLAKGHHNVKLDDEAYQRLACWVDLNAPHRGQWSPPKWQGQDQVARRLELQKLYDHVDCNPRDEFLRSLARTAKRKIKFVKPKPLAKTTAGRIDVPGWPFDRTRAAARQKTAQAKTNMTVDLGGKMTMDLTLIPAGTFVMGDTDGSADERPLARVKVDKPYWMGVCEVTNAQFNLFDKTHDSRFIDKQFTNSERGYPVNGPQQPVVRVNWLEAMAFCRWLSAKTRRSFTLPTEAQWEWACRAGSAEAMGYGPVDADFRTWANLGDAMLRRFSIQGVKNAFPGRRGHVFKGYDFLPRIDTVNDGVMVSAAVGTYKANPWGLKDMHGNVAEWTRTAYRPYPYAPSDGRDAPNTVGRKVVRGGSWRDRPMHARSAFRLPYQRYQRVFNVGFRVICEVRTPPAPKPH